MAWYDQYRESLGVTEPDDELTDDEIRAQFGFDAAPSAPPPAEQRGGFLSTIGQGFLTGLEGDVAMVDYAVGSSAATDAALEKLSAGQRYLTERMAPEYRDASIKHWLSDEPDETLGEAWGDPYAYANAFGQALGSLGALVVTGGPLKGLITKAIGRTALKESSKRAANAVAGAGAYGAAEAAMIGGLTGRGVEQEILGMDESVLIQAPIYQQRYWALRDENPDIDDKALRQRVREDVARNLAEMASTDSGLIITSLALGSVAGRFIDSAISGALKGTGRLRAAAFGVAAETPTEAGQGAMEQYTQNVYVGQVDPSIAATRGVAEAAVAEAIGGGMVGGALGFARGGIATPPPPDGTELSSTDTAPAQETYVEQLTDQMSLPGFDDGTQPAAPVTPPTQAPAPQAQPVAVAEPTIQDTVVAQPVDEEAESVARIAEQVEQREEPTRMQFRSNAEMPAPTRALRTAVEQFNVPLQTYQEESARSTRGRPYRANAEQLRALDDVWNDVAAQISGLENDGYNTTELRNALMKAAAVRSVTGKTIQQRGGNPVTGRIKGGDIQALGGRSKNTPKGGWGKVANELFTGVYRAFNKMLQDGPVAMPQAQIDITGDIGTVAQERPVQERGAPRPRVEEPTGYETTPEEEAQILKEREAAAAPTLQTEEAQQRAAEIEAAAKKAAESKVVVRKKARPKLDKEETKSRPKLDKAKEVAKARREKHTIPKTEALEIKLGKQPKRKEQKERRADIKRRQRVDQMSPEEMRQELMVDKLTGLGTKRAMEEDADTVKRKSYVFIDIDRLKATNDAFGHEAGDALLRTMGDAMNEALKDAGVIGSYHLSGDEFVFMTPNAAISRQALKVLREVADTKSIAAGDQAIPLSFSAGIAPTLKAADAKMNANKAARRKVGTAPERGEALLEKVTKGEPTVPDTKESYVIAKTIIDMDAPPDLRQDILDQRAVATSAVNELIGNIAEPVSGSDVLNILLRSLSIEDPYYRIVQLLSGSGAANTQVQKTTTDGMWALTGSRRRADDSRVVPSGNFRVISDQDGATPEVYIVDSVLEGAQGIRTLLHEYTHAATALGLTTDNALAVQLDNIRRQVRAALQKTGNAQALQQYGLKNVDDFIAEVFSNVNFQRILAGIKVRKAPGNLLSKFVQAVADFLGLDTSTSTVLSEVMALAHDLIMSPEQVADALQRPIVPDAFVSSQLDPDRARIVKTLRSLESDELGRTTGKVYDRVVGASGFDVQELVRSSNRVGLGFHTLDQLIRRFSTVFQQGDDNPLRKYWNIVRQKTSMARDEQQRAENINKLWRKFEKAHPKLAEALNDLMHDSTVLGIHPDLPLNHPINKHLDPSSTMKNTHAAMQKRFNALSPTGRGVYRKVRDYYKKQRAELRRTTVEHIARSNGLHEALPKPVFERLVNVDNAEDLKNIDFSVLEDRANDVRSALRQTVSLTSVLGPYFPLRRYGKYVVEGQREGKQVGAVFEKRAKAWEAARELRITNPMAKIRTRKNEDGSFYNEMSSRIVTMHDTISEANEAAARLNKQGYTNARGGKVNVSLKENWEVPPGSAANVLLGQAKRKFSADSPQAKALDTAFLELLLENSVRKAELQRRNVEGASRDMRRAFAERAYAGSWGIADVKTALEHRSAIRDMAKAARGDVRMGELVQEIKIRDERALAERKVSTLDRSVSRLGFVWYLLSPSYTFVNLTQVPLVAGPYLAGKYGNTKAAAELLISYRGVASAAANEWTRLYGGVSGPPTNILDAVKSVLNDGERKMIDELSKFGIIDATFMQDLYETTRGTHETAARTVSDKILDIARTSPQIAEVVNRVVVARAAYNLEMRRSNGNVRHATEAASEAVLQTQFDYTDQNKPRYFKAFPGARAIMMFKMYAQGMYALLLNNVTRMAKGKPAERQEARRIFGGVIASHSLAAGVLGGVFIEPVRALIGLAALAFEDDDEPWDLDRAVTGALADLTDPYTAELVARGLPRAAGVDLSGRVGLNNLAFMGIRESRSAQEWYTNVLMAAGGPVVAAGLSIARGADYMRKGELRRGIESSSPKLIRDIIKANRFNDDGMMDFNGNVIAGKQDFSTGDAIVQALGLTPVVAARTYEGRFAQKNLETKLRDRRRRLMQRWRSADPKERARFFRENIVPFSRKNPDFAISVDQLLRSLREQRRREAGTRGGAFTEAQQIRNVGEAYVQ